MDALLILLGLLLALTLIVGLPLLLIIYPYKKLRKTRFKKYAFLMPIIVIGFIVFEIYVAVYPPDSFYKEDFESITNLTFPKSGKILFKDASYPDQHGHYTSVAIISLSPEDYKKLFRQVTSDNVFEADTTMFNNDMYEEVTNQISDKQVRKTVRKGKMLIGFLNDNRRVILQRRLSDNY